jgi:tetratricopeptide (TPR) repeat protein
MSVNGTMTPLKVALQEKGWSYTRLISEMRVVAAKNGRTLPKAESLTVMISRWVNGRDHPDAFNQKLLCEALGKTPVELGFGPAPESLLARTSSYAEPWELIEAVERPLIGAVALAELERTVVSYVQAYPSTPPATLLQPVIEHLRRIIDKLNQAQPPKQRQRLDTVAALLAATAGSLSFDLRNPEKALAYFGAAMIAGDEAEDDDLRAWILATQSLVFTYTTHHTSALELLGRALEFAMRSSPTRQAWVAALKAKAHAAHAGQCNDMEAHVAHMEQYNCMRALELAHVAISRAQKDGPRPGTDFFDQPRLDGLRGSCLALLGKADDARVILEQVLYARDKSNLKGLALVKLDLASTYIADKQPEEACSLVTDALSIPHEVHVDPILRQAVLVRGRLDPWKNIPAVKQLDDLLRALLATPLPCVTTAR